LSNAKPEVVLRLADADAGNSAQGNRGLRDMAQTGKDHALSEECNKLKKKSL